MPILLVIAGPNGSGKTTFTKNLVDLNRFPQDVYINPDDIAQNMPGGWHNTENFLPAAQEADRRRQKRLSEGQDIVFETVFSSPQKLDFLRQAKDSRYEVHLNFLCTENPSIHAARVCERVMNNGHSVPIEKIISRYFRSIEMSVRALEAVTTARFWDTTTHNAPPRLVAWLSENTLALDDDLPQWMAPVEAHGSRIFAVGRLRPDEALSLPNQEFLAEEASSESVGGLLDRRGETLT
ncbi:AAA family ATPase [Acidithiobacillus thiooxidans]|uniref:zeta toxin family protein n=1 Tax=Acidithiobacillus thiooxidans TaxID=930 RepID=UPI001C072EBC|nr:zeta toxin family protein [Acidithiobacillus thiooxidans]MBU2792599.1 AAA family ATPase [Acidithiobacillus thiooxidans]